MGMEFEILQAGDGGIAKPARHFLVVMVLGCNYYYQPFGGIASKKTSFQFCRSIHEGPHGFTYPCPFDPFCGKLVRFPPGQFQQDYQEHWK
jgi:hypothetical protein